MAVCLAAVPLHVTSYDLASWPNTAEARGGGGGGGAGSEGLADAGATGTPAFVQVLIDGVAGLFGGEASQTTVAAVNQRRRRAVFVVYFDVNSAALNDVAQAVVAEAEAALRDIPSAQVAILGNASLEGSRENNRILSELRAGAVAKAIADRGVSQGDISTRAFGGSRPVVRVSGNAGRRINRRVEIIIE